MPCIVNDIFFIFIKIFFTVFMIYAEYICNFDDL